MIGCFDILVVEDNEGEALLVSRLLSSLKQIDKVHVKRSRDEALALLRGETEDSIPDFVLLDLYLSSQSGVGILEEMRRTPGLAHIPVVVFSGSRDPNDVVEAYRIGASAFVRKPDTQTGYETVIQALADFWWGFASLPDVQGSVNDER